MITDSVLHSRIKPAIFGRDTIRLLRIPFSYFLLPVFLFAISQARDLDLWNVFFCFVVLHLFIYPASNGYNSYMDNDEGSIGGLKHPPRPTRSLFYATLLFDAAGLLLSLFISVQFFLSIAAYILASRAYSYSGIRLKKYPVIGLLTVVFFQGAFTFWMVYNAVNITPLPITTNSLLAVFACSFLVAGFYPLTQVYQHEQDKLSGDITISYVLGHKGTFVFSAVMFLCAAALLFIYFSVGRDLFCFMLFLLFSLPVSVYFIWWFIQVFHSSDNASFENAMHMNMIGATCLNMCFVSYLILNTLQ